MDRRSFLRWGSMGLAIGLATACSSSATPAPPPPTAATLPPAPLTESPAPAPAPSAAPAIGPSSSPSPSAVVAAGTGADWQQVIDAANREGALVIVAPQGDATRDALLTSFQQAHPEIQVDYTGMDSAQMPPKLSVEQGASQFTTDLIVAGSTTALLDFIPGNIVVPVAPYLGGPGTSDLSKWLNSRLEYADAAAQYNLVYSAYLHPAWIVNSSVSTDQFGSYWDLTDPQWKGQIAFRDPRVAGGGQGDALFFWAAPGLGKPFLQALFSQDAILSEDDQQIIDWVAHGQYPIELGASDPLTNEAISRSLPLTRVSPRQMKEGTYLTSGPGSISIPRNPPHPHALRVYLDWFLSADGQEAWVKNTGFPSLRTDLPADPSLDIFQPRPGDVFLATYEESYQDQRSEMLDFLKTVLS